MNIQIEKIRRDVQGAIQILNLTSEHPLEAHTNTVHVFNTIQQLHKVDELLRSLSEAQHQQQKETQNESTKTTPN